MRFSYEPELGDREARVLDFDIETYAAGFADPAWVPQKITCVSWRWLHWPADEVESRVCDATGLFYDPDRRADMLYELLMQISQADVITGHNIVRFDLRVINTECMRLNLPLPGPQTVQDTIKLPKSLGFKKGLDNLGYLYKIRNQKMPLNWQQWDDAYAERGWPVIRQRCESDVLAHEEVRQEQISRGILKQGEWKP